MALPSNIVLVTGANQGVGYEIVKKLAREHPDYHIYLGARNPARGHEAERTLRHELNSENITFLHLDVTDPSSISSAASSVSKQHGGKLDVLICNAGIMLDEDSSLASREKLTRTFAVNVVGVVDTTEAFLPLLKKSENAKIVYISSALGSLTNRMGSAPESAYSQPTYRASKAALNMIMRDYSVMLKGDGIKINSCCPGFVATNINGYHENAGPVTDGAIRAVQLATMGKDGPTGTYSNKDGKLPW